MLLVGSACLISPACALQNPRRAYLSLKPLYTSWWHLAECLTHNIQISIKLYYLFFFSKFESVSVRVTFFFFFFCPSLEKWLIWLKFLISCFFWSCFLLFLPCGVLIYGQLSSHFPSCLFHINTYVLYIHSFYLQVPSFKTFTVLELINKWCCHFMRISSPQEARWVRWPLPCGHCILWLIWCAVT